MNRAQFALALAHVRELHTLEEVADDLPLIQDGLWRRLGVHVTPTEARDVWELLAEQLWASGWTRVDAGSLDAAASAILAAYRWALAQEDATEENVPCPP
jgi:hypothetical protein